MGYSNGILTLAIGAITLVYFPRNTERLIPLYTIGVFIPFCSFLKRGWLSIGFVNMVRDSETLFS